MVGFDRELWNYFCPSCKSSRRLKGSPRPGIKHFFQILLTSAVLTGLLWKYFAWKGMVVMAPLWVGFEVVYRMRIRVQLACQQCGFDPYLYLSDIGRARKEIESHWRRKFAEKGIPFPEKQQEAAKINPPQQ